MRYHTPVFVLGIWEYTKATNDICLNAKLTKQLRVEKLNISNNNCPETVIDTNITSLKITSLHHTFENCYWLKEIIFDKNIIFENITNIRCMFKNCINLERLILSENMFPNIIESKYSLEKCKKLNISFYEDIETKQPIIELGKLLQNKEDLNLIIRTRKLLKLYSNNVIRDKIISICKYEIIKQDIKYSELIKLYIKKSEYFDIVEFLSKTFNKMDIGIVSL